MAYNLENPAVMGTYHEESRPLVGHCIHCNSEIRGEDGIWGCDAHYDIPGYGLICWDCLRDWARDFLMEG